MRVLFNCGSLLYMPLLQPSYSSPQQFACWTARTIDILPLEPSQEAHEGHGGSRAIQEGHREGSIRKELRSLRPERWWLPQHGCAEAPG